MTTYITCLTPSPYLFGHTMETQRLTKWLDIMAVDSRWLVMINSDAVVIASILTRPWVVEISTHMSYRSTMQLELNEGNYTV